MSFLTPAPYRAYETLSDDKKRQIYEATGMDSNEQQATGAGQGPFTGGFGFNPFGGDFWSQFTGSQAGGKGGQEKGGSGNVDDLFKEFEQFFSMGGEGGTKTRGSSQSAGKAKGKDVNVNRQHHTSYYIGQYRH